ncbi:DNA-binding response regulator, OmpR family, contains REC and winged-helix (wHTH) domain [Oscillospiraceae bacterium]|nr:DNA-binding response regulator, OmpR family, contains REC and winged-helix (wHTH) domain [Oscillospiraceae bacterium]
MRYDCLIIDDEKELADNTRDYFDLFDVKSYSVYGRDEALDFLKENEVSLILLDINLGDGSGFELCKKIREEIDIPILFISARNTDDDKLIALNIGGDDYIEKPYSMGVILAKVKIFLKRFGKSNPSASDVYEDSRISIDKVNKTLTVEGNIKKLTSLEFTLLSYLTDNPGRLITKKELFDNVWKDKFTSDGTLNVHIRKLREAIEKDPQEPSYIVTVWKEGYKFIPEQGR